MGLQSCVFSCMIRQTSPPPFALVDSWVISHFGDVDTFCALDRIMLDLFGRSFAAMKGDLWEGHSDSLFL